MNFYYYYYFYKFFYRLYAILERQQVFLRVNIYILHRICQTVAKRMEYQSYNTRFRASYCEAKESGNLEDGYS